MEIENLQERITANQIWLLEISEKINHSIAHEGKSESISTWVTHIMSSKSEILKAFHIQSEQKICDAVMVLLEADSSYREPLLKMLIYRVLIYAHSAVDLNQYTENNATLKQSAENLKLLIELADNYTTEYLESLTIETVCDSLQTSGLKEYIVHFKETDIQIVLKTIKADSAKTKNRAKFVILLNFLFARLSSNYRKNGTISASRHAWWALKDILYNQDTEWLLAKKTELEGILIGLIGNGIYFEKKNIPTIEILETTSSYYERVWVVENAIQILKITQSRPGIFHEEGVTSLREFIHKNIDLHSKSVTRENHLRNVQCDLVLLYYVLNNYELIYQNLPSDENAVMESNSLSVEDVLRAINK